MLIVYGGAFNPLTAAHQAAIRALRAQHPKDTLVLLPSGVSGAGGNGGCDR